MNKYHSCISYLMSKNIQNISHGNKTFFDHLVGVYNFLNKIGQPEHVCFAGLFHSIYGNDIFKIKTEEDRNTIKKLIGDEAEKLVWIFNSTPREKLLQTQNGELKIILLVNDLDQIPLFEYIDKLYSELFTERINTSYDKWIKLQYILRDKNV